MSTWAFATLLVVAAAMLWPRTGRDGMRQALIAMGLVVALFAATFGWASVVEAVNLRNLGPDPRAPTLAFLLYAGLAVAMRVGADFAVAKQRTLETLAGAGLLFLFSLLLPSILPVALMAIAFALPGMARPSVVGKWSAIVGAILVLLISPLLIIGAVLEVESAMYGPSADSVRIDGNVTFHDVPEQLAHLGVANQTFQDTEIRVLSAGEAAQFTGNVTLTATVPSTVEINLGAGCFITYQFQLAVGTHDYPWQDAAGDVVCT